MLSHSFDQACELLEIVSQISHIYDTWYDFKVTWVFRVTYCFRLVSVFVRQTLFVI